MAISIETLALARKYADAVAAAGSKEALDKAIQKAIAESKLYTDDVFSHIVEIVDSLPETDINPHVIYFLKKENPSEKNDIYYEYMYINNFWELIGSTDGKISDVEDEIPIISVNDTEENLIIVKKGETKEPTK